MEELTRKPVTIYYNRGVADKQKREDAEAHPPNSEDITPAASPTAKAASMTRQSWHLPWQ